MSGRELPPELSAEISKPALRPFLAIRIETPDPVYGWTGRGEIEFGGFEWTGVQGIASVDAIGETIDGSATGVKATLNRIPSELADDLADQAVRGCLYELFVGALDETYGVVRGFKKVWKGTLQTYDIDDGGDTLTVTAGGESRAIDQRRPAIKRFTDAWHQRKFPGDRFFEYVPRLAEISILWAKGAQSAL